MGMTVQHTGDMKAMQSPAWISVLVESLPRCVTLSKSLILSKPNFLICRVEGFVVDTSYDSFRINEETPAK